MKKSGRACSPSASKAASCLFFVLCACCASAGNVSVETLVADEVRTFEISALPEVSKDAVLYYAFAKDMGSLVVDSSPNGRNGTVSGAVWSGEGKYNGGAMLFPSNGGISRIVVSLPMPYFFKESAYSVSAWFLHDGTYVGLNNNGQKIIDLTCANGTYYWRLHVISSGSNMGALGFTFCNFPPIYVDPVIRTMTDASQNYMDNTWHHVVVVRNGNIGQLWVDGVLKQQISNMIAPSANNMSQGMGIGNSLVSATAQKNWYGKLDEIQIFQRALSPEEILILHQNSLPPISVTSDLVLDGNLTVTGEAVFEGGIRHVLPLGDLSSGIYTNAP